MAGTPRTCRVARDAAHRARNARRAEEGYVGGFAILGERDLHFLVRAYADEGVGHLAHDGGGETGVEAQEAALGEGEAERGEEGGSGGARTAVFQGLHAHFEEVQGMRATCRHGRCDASEPERIRYSHLSEHKCNTDGEDRPGG